jgi:hypothetical protein
MPNYKFQMTNKFQTSKFKTLGFGHWDFDIIWDLVLGTWNL